MNFEGRSGGRRRVFVLPINFYFGFRSCAYSTSEWQTEEI